MEKSTRPRIRRSARVESQIRIPRGRSSSYWFASSESAVYRRPRQKCERKKSRNFTRGKKGEKHRPGTRTGSIFGGLILISSSVPKSAFSFDPTQSSLYCSLCSSVNRLSRAGIFFTFDHQFPVYFHHIFVSLRRNPKPTFANIFRPKTLHELLSIGLW